MFLAGNESTHETNLAIAAGAVHHRLDRGMLLLPALLLALRRWGRFLRPGSISPSRPAPTSSGRSGRSIRRRRWVCRRLLRLLLRFVRRTGRRRRAIRAHEWANVLRRRNADDRRLRRRQLRARSDDERRLRFGKLRLGADLRRDAVRCVVRLDDSIDDVASGRQRACACAAIRRDADHSRSASDSRLDAVVGPLAWAGCAAGGNEPLSVRRVARQSACS